jgi:hypothetical protein
MLHRLAREGDDGKNPEDGAERNEQALDAGENEAKPITPAAGQETTRQEDPGGEGLPEEKEKATDPDEEPAEERWRWLSVRRMGGSMQDEYTHRAIEQREEGEQRRQGSHDVMEDGQQSQMLFILWHHLNGFQSDARCLDRASLKIRPRSTLRAGTPPPASRPNENKISDGYRKRAPIEVEGYKSLKNMVTQRVAARLGVADFPAKPTK